MESEVCQIGKGVSAQLGDGFFGKLFWKSVLQLGGLEWIHIIDIITDRLRHYFAFGGLD